MSDLANSCEYLTIDKLCSALSESEKAKANRQAKCQNEEKLACCYLCLARRECSIRCRFLGNAGAEASPVTKTQTTFDADKKCQAPQTETTPATCCSSCNVELSQARTKLKVDGWSKPYPKLSEGVLGEGFLSVTVCVCPKCGKIEFRTA